MTWCNSARIFGTILLFHLKFSLGLRCRDSQVKVPQCSIMLVKIVTHRFGHMYSVVLIVGHAGIQYRHCCIHITTNHTVLNSEQIGWELSSLAHNLHCHYYHKVCSWKLICSNRP